MTGSGAIEMTGSGAIEMTGSGAIEMTGILCYEAEPCNKISSCLDKTTIIVNQKTEFFLLGKSE